ncbi:MAG TPA: hypothetical protein VMV73_01795 [Candidatus Dormibacteraeota bacterium]|nr:hypothetical protein [Candidatus Dormibacteraeota bacterium]
MVHRQLAPLLALLLVGVASSGAPAPTPSPKPPTLLHRLNTYLLSHGVHPGPRPTRTQSGPPSFPLHGSMIVKPDAIVRVECGRGFIACELHVIAYAGDDARLHGELWGPRGSVVHLHVSGPPSSPRFWFSVDDRYASRTRAHAYVRAELLLPRTASLQFSGTTGMIEVDGLTGACRFDGAQTNVRADGCKSVDAMTSSGNVALSLPTGLRPHLRVSTVAGSITLTVPRTFSGRVHASSLQGFVSNPLSIGSAAGSIDLASISGEIWVRRAP